MAKLHLIYDPNDLISTDMRDMQKATGMKVALISISESLDYEGIHATAMALADMLLRQIKKEDCV